MRESPKGSIQRWRWGKNGQELLPARGAGGDARRLRRPEWRRLERTARKSRDVLLVRRLRIVVLLARGWTGKAIAEAVGCAISTVHNTRHRWAAAGEAGLIDRREDNGAVKRTEDFLSALWKVLVKTPQDFCWPRPTWTRELLIHTLVDKGYEPVSLSTMSRALHEIGARQGRPKPVVLCPWAKSVKTRRLNEIKAMIAGLKLGEVAVYVDEVDIHLNPKIGPDWMLPGHQRQVVTPGQNRKHYLAGALDARTRRITWVASDHKNSSLFIALVERLLEVYPDARVINIVLDNFKIHDSHQTRAFLAGLGGRVRLHFLPPYCPDHNRIERTWLDLHANVTRNHRHKKIESLLQACVAYLAKRNRRLAAQKRKKAA